VNELLTNLYRASRPKEALASQDEFKSANALLGSDVEKFAELIIRECMEVARKADGLDAEYEAWYLIKEHFGIKQ
jgi:hypothetical protein